MKSVFDKNNYDELNNRLQKLAVSSTPLWGKMNIGQMLHHLNRTMEAPLGKYQGKGKPVFLMRLFKSVLYNDRPFGKGSPTAKDFKISGGSYDFETEKEKAVSNLKEIFDKGAEGNYLPHLFFGKLTNQQWGMHFYKHADHHLKQFGV
jgi:Protein of unknown function (DUF1569)